MVQDLRLSWPGLEEVDSVRLDYTLRPGATAALIIPFGSAVCDTSEPATDDAYAVMTLVDVGELRVPITDGLQTLTRLHERDCTRRELERRCTSALPLHRPGRCSTSAASRCCVAD